MIPSSKWFPTALADRAAWFQNFATNFAALAADLGFLPADVTSVNADNATVQALTNYSFSVDTFASAVTAFRKEVLEGTNSAVAATPPAVPDLGATPISLPGVYDRLDNLVKRIKLAPKYSEEEGTQLGIVSPKVAPISPADMQPVLKTSVLPGNIVNVVFKRGTSGGVCVETMVDKEVAWTPKGNYFSSPAVINIPPSADNLPRAVQIRSRYLDKGVQVGLWSETYNVVTLP